MVSTIGTSDTSPGMMKLVSNSRVKGKSGFPVFSFNFSAFSGLHGTVPFQLTT